MTYFRLSIVKSRPGHEEEVQRLLADLNAAASASDGCLETHLARSSDESGDFVRMAIYRDAASAEHAASDDHILSLRSRLHLLVEPGHSERAFIGL